MPSSPRRGQSSVEPMLALTAVLLGLCAAAWIFDAQFVTLLGRIFDWAGPRLPLP